MSANRIVLLVCGVLCAGAALAQATKPKIIEQKAPGYPAEAEAARQGGRVVLRVGVKEDGAIESVDVATSTGFPLLDRAAVDAVKTWRFAPAKDEQGKAVAGVASFALTFTPPTRELDTAITCGQLGEQVAQLRTASPGASLDNIPALGAFKDLAEATDAVLPIAMRGEIIAAVPQLLEDVVEACAGQPKSTVFDTYLALKKAGPRGK